MSTKTLAAAAAVAMSLAMIPAQAEAKTKVDVDVYLGGGYGWGPGYGWGGGYYPVGPSYGISCHKGKKIVRWAGYKNVHAFDCGAPVYQYKAWKWGNPYRIRVNMAGNIIGVKPL